MSKSNNEIEDMLSEKVHYELVPSDDPHGWDVRILEEFPETVITFGAIKFEGIDESGEDGEIRFDFSIKSTPDDKLSTEDLTFQAFVGKILNSVIGTAIAEGTMMAQDSDGKVMATEETHEELDQLYNEYQSRTDSTAESTDK